MSTTNEMTASMRARSAHLLVVVLLTLAGAVGIAVSSATLAPSPANAACTGAMSGTWRNINADTRSVTRVDLSMRTCGDVRVCDAATGVCTTSGTSYTIRVFGKCSPTDCDWGARTTADAGNGWQRTAYVYSWATKHVWVKTYQYYGRTYLRVWVHTDFTAADGRQDYTTDEWMLK